MGGKKICSTPYLQALLREVMMLSFISTLAQPIWI